MPAKSVGMLVVLKSTWKELEIVLGAVEWLSDRNETLRWIVAIIFSN